MRQALRPGMPLPGPPRTSAVLRERLPQTWACPHSRARVLSVLPTPHCSLSRALAFFPWTLACRARVGVQAGPGLTPGGLSAICAGAAGSTWEPWGGSSWWGWSPEVREADPPCVRLGSHRGPFPRGLWGGPEPFAGSPVLCRLGWGEPCPLGCP